MAISKSTFPKKGEQGRPPSSSQPAALSPARAGVSGAGGGKQPRGALGFTKRRPGSLGAGGLRGGGAGSFLKQVHGLSPGRAGKHL